MEIWPRYATDIRRGQALPCGHYLSEEAPNETYAELRAFFAAPQSGSAPERGAVPEPGSAPAA
jgi:haloacetate dehalogenase